MSGTKKNLKNASNSSRVITSVAEVRNSLATATKDSLWISYETRLTDALLKNVTWPTRSLGDAIFVHSMAPRALPALASCFKRFAYATDGSFLPLEELDEVLRAPNRDELFIGGAVDCENRIVTLWRGNLESLSVPFSAFEAAGDGAAPDFARFSITDWGQTIRLGKYEAAADAILYEFDPEYRRRIAKRRRETERSFGASLRRLRKQRGLSREDFGPDIAAKTISRIEQGKVARVQKKTLDRLATRLRVKPDEIATF